MAAFLVVGYCILHVCLWSKKEQKSKQEHIIAEKYGTGDLVERGKFARGKKRISSVPLCSQLINICIITMYLVWSWCSLCILQVMFDCSDKGDGQGVRRLSFDVKEVCYRPGTAHRTFLIFVGMPGFLVYVVGAPLAVGTILFRVRNRLGDQIVLNRYGFLLAGYRREKFYWEIVVMARRFCVVLAVVALDSMLELQLAVCSLVCLIFLVLHVVYSPYASDEATLLSRLNVALGAHLAAEASVTSAQTTGRKETKTNGPDSYANPMNCSRSVKLENKSEILSRHVRGTHLWNFETVCTRLTSTSHRLAVGLRIENDSSIQARQSLGDVPAGQETRQHDTEDGTENIRTIPAATRGVAAYGKSIACGEKRSHSQLHHVLLGTFYCW